MVNVSRKLLVPPGRRKMTIALWTPLQTTEERTKVVPDVALANALKGKKGVIVFEKALSYGYEGALTSDLKSALYEHLAGTGALPTVQNFIAGIGGRDIRTEDLTQTLRAATKSRVAKEPVWIGLKL